MRTTTRSSGWMTTQAFTSVTEAPRAALAARREGELEGEAAADGGGGLEEEAALRGLDGHGGASSAFPRRA